MGPEVFQTISQEVGVPSGIENPEWVVGSAVAAGLAYAYTRYRQRNAQEEFAIDFRGNEALLEQSIRTAEEEGEYDPEGYSKQRRRPVALMAAGAALAASSVFGHFMIENKIPNEDARTMVVLDSGYSMTETTDLGDASKSRRELSLGALESALSETTYEGELGVIEFGADTNVTNFSDDWESVLSGLSDVGVEENGGFIMPAAELAQQLLSNGEEAGKMVIISDGTVTAGQNNVERLQQIEQQLNEQNIDVDVVVPGQANSTYTLESGQEYDSGATTEVYSSAFADVKSATNQEQLAEQIHNVINEEATTSRESQSDIPLWGGLALLAYGFAVDVNQRSKKVI